MKKNNMNYSSKLSLLSPTTNRKHLLKEHVKLHIKLFFIIFFKVLFFQLIHWTFFVLLYGSV